MKKKLLAGLLTVALAITGIVVMPTDAEAADTEAADKTAVYYDEKGSFKMSDYWSEDSKKVPMLDGYVFGGWYTKGSDNTYSPLKKAELTDESVSSISAVAKFVPADVLSVKTQLATETTDGTTKAFLRLLSTTDSYHYQKVGFEYQLGSRAVAEKEMTRIYSAIKPSKSSNTILEPDETFVAASGYFIALDINNIAEASFASIVYARAYWITEDGTKVMGLARNNRVEDKQNNYISASVNLLTDGMNPASIAAGKIVMTYNTAAYDVVVADGAYKVDIGKVFSEMNYAVNEEKGTITFVGNASNVNEVILADGLYANVRFVKTANTSEDATLQFEVGTVEGGTEAPAFCDWAEDWIQDDTLSVQ